MPTGSSCLGRRPIHVRPQGSVRPSLILVLGALACSLALAGRATAFTTVAGSFGHSTFGSNGRRACPSVSRWAMRRDGQSEAQRKRKEAKWEDMDNIMPRYEYVGGGFEEASPQGKAANSSLYKAFDSALRASDYNMFCAPLKKVDAPTAFKAKGMSPEAEEAMLSPEPAEDPEEVARRIADEYAEFDRLVAGSSIKSDGQARLLKGKKGKLGSTNTRVRGRSVPTEKEDASTPDTVQKAPQAASSDAPTQPRGRTKVRGLEGLGEFKSEFADRPMAEPTIDGGAQNSQPRGTTQPVSRVNQEEVQEGYDELQALLGMKPKPGARTRMDSAVIKGNQTELRAGGVYKSVTLKDPLKRVYAQRLKDLPADIGSEEAVMRAPSPNGRVRTPSPATRPMSQQAVNDSGDGKDAPNFVDDFLSEMRGGGGEAETSPRTMSAGKRAKDRKGKGGGGSSGSGQQGMSKPVNGGSGRVVMNHSTHIDGLIPVLQRLAQTQGVATVVPARLAKTPGRSQGLQLRITTATVDGFKLIARHGQQSQEVSKMGIEKHSRGRERWMDAECQATHLLFPFLFCFFMLYAVSCRIFSQRIACNADQKLQTPNHEF